ncbi:hypothetical protein CR970_04080 [Candidatus Saccharibacteria bacterium]|nr:MAG: hypothetical protein CR970_04080 [Candidatus Saccharibacteria bacterium]
MAFNHYAKLKRIIAEEPEGWYIRCIDQPTTATNFRGEKVHYPHYYRLYSAADQPIKYGKFQKIDKLARTLGVDVNDLPVIDGVED